MKNFKYNWEEIQAYYDNGHTGIECMEKYGFSHTALYRARKNGYCNIWTRKLPLEQLMSGNVTSAHLKKRLVVEGILEDICASCGQLPFWNGAKLVLQLDHIDGNHSNNILSNLRILCPNCHTQTATWGTKIRHRANSLL